MFSGQEWHCNVTLLYFWPLAENKRADQTASHTSGGIQWIYWTVQSLDNWRGEITWQIQNPTTKQRVSIPTWGQPVTHRHTHTFTHTLARSVTLSRTHSHTHAAADLTPYLTWTCPSSTTQDLPSEAPCMLIYYNKTENGVFVQVRVW